MLVTERWRGLNFAYNVEYLRLEKFIQIKQNEKVRNFYSANFYVSGKEALRLAFVFVLIGGLLN